MKITTIGIQYSRKVNLGDFESAEATVSYYAQLNQDDPHELEDEVAMQILVNKARNNVKAALMPVCKASEYQLSKAKLVKKFMSKVVGEEEIYTEDEF